MNSEQFRKIRSMENVREFFKNMQNVNGNKRESIVGGGGGGGGGGGEGQM